MQAIPPGAFVVLVAVAVLAALWLARGRPLPRVTVYEWEQGLLYRRGVFAGLLPPGRYLSGRFGREVARVATRSRLLVLPAQDMLTTDGFSVKLGAVLHWQVTDARRFHAATAEAAMASGPEQLHVALQLALRDQAATRPLDALLAARADLGAFEAGLLGSVARAAEAIGARVDGVAVRDIILPAEVRRMLTDVERARREGLAALERARGEHAALRSLANAARLLRGNPELQVLRTLQALTPEAGRAAPTLHLTLTAASGGTAPLDPTAEST